jgi:mannosyltransferase
MYTVRYLSFCTPAAAALIALGVHATAAWAARRVPVRAPLIGTAVLAVLLAAFVPNLVVQRAPYAKDGSDWREAAAYLRARAQPGDAVVYDARPKDSEAPRLIAAVYPSAVAGLRDPALLSSYRGRAGLWDRTRPNTALTAADLGGVAWLVERGPAAAASPDVRHLETLGYRIRSEHRVDVTTILRMTR